MTKYLLLITFSLIFSFGVDSSESTHKSYALNVIPVATPPVQSETDKLVLDKNEVYLPCPPGYRCIGGRVCDSDMTIVVSAGKSQSNQLNYEYTVSGGRIIGEGAKVTWDMTGAEPGTYQIRVDIEDKSKGQKQTETKIITVKNHNCFMDCVCPTLSANAPTSPTKAGEMMIFTANVSGGSGEEITYNWTISDGEIIEGQGTPVIKVSTNPKMAGKTIEATVEIGGVCEECLKTESASGSVASAKRVKK
jgi:hypothetical protein